MNKRKWEDWQFSFYLQNSSWQLVDLNWYTYSIVIESKWKVEILRENWEITISWQELIKIIPASQTKDLATWTYNIEYKITSPEWNTFITEKQPFEVVSTLHYN